MDTAPRFPADNDAGASGGAMPRRAKVKRAAQEESWLSAQRAWDIAIAITKTAELAKPTRERNYFSIAELADGLARPAGLAVPEQRERDYLCELLLAQASRGDFLDESGGPGAYVLRGEAPFFTPLEVSLPDHDAVMRIVVLSEEETFLSRSATHLFLRQSSLAAARRLLTEWFGVCLEGQPQTVRLMDEAEDAETGLESSRNKSEAPKKRRGSDKEIREAMNRYLKDETRGLNMDRAVTFVLDEFALAGRDRVRDIYRDVTGSRKRGRPSKSTT